MYSPVPKSDLYRWCSIPAADLVGHRDLRVPFRLCRSAFEMAQIMARELVDQITQTAAAGRYFRAIIPCGPAGWYRPFTDLVNSEQVSLEHVIVYHMDECLDWQARPLPMDHPYSFRGFMEQHFYRPIDEKLQVPKNQRRWLAPENVEAIADELDRDPADIAYGGWGQDGHVAYNQARRSPYSTLTVEDLASSTARVQENNWDTVIALAQRSLGGAYQFVPPMSVTLGMKEILSASRVRLFSDTGAWKQTALRVGLFSDLTPEYPLTLLQRHADALLTATADTADHPISRHPEWDLGL